MNTPDLDKVVTWSESLSKKWDNSSIDREDIERQHATARDIVERLSSEEYPAVLLSDEVGMGKTFVALAAIATFLSTSRKSRVLLVVPQSDVLKRKWLQDISTFQKEYVTSHFPNLLRAAEVDGLMDLISATNDYKNISISRLQNEDDRKYAFLWALKEFKKGDWFLFHRWVRSVGMEKVYYQSVFEGAYETISKFALQRYFESDRTLDDFVKKLNAGVIGTELNDKLKAFLAEQETYLPNLFIIRMSRLSFPRRNNYQVKTFGSVLVDVLCHGREESTIAEVLGALQNSFICPIADFRYEKMCPGYVRDFRAQSEPFGLRSFLQSIEGQKLIDNFSYEDKSHGNVTWSELYPSLRRGEHADLAHKFLCGLREKIVPRLLARAPFDLCVVDEAHNWKSGEANGALEFRDLVQGATSKVLLMSATPFQIDPMEFSTLFETAACASKTTKTARALERLYAEGNGLVATCISRSKKFHECWSRLTVSDLEEVWTQLNGDQKSEGVQAILQVISTDVGNSSELTEFAKRTMEYATSLRALSNSLRDLMIRHTKERIRLNSGKKASNRHFHSGSDYKKSPIELISRQITRLPSARGYISDDEDLALFEFLAMRFDQLLREHWAAQKRSSATRKSAAAHLMNGLTSSFSAFRESQSRKQVALISDPEIDVYKECLNKVSGQGGLLHPKVEATCARLLSNWDVGRKTLVFCYRVATVDEIVSTVNERIKAKLDSLCEPFPFLSRELQATLQRSYLFREDRIWMSMLVLNIPNGTSLRNSDLYKATKEFLSTKDVSLTLSKAAEEFGRTVSDRARRLMWTIDAICLKRFLVEKPVTGITVPPWLKELVKRVSVAELVEILEKASVARRPQSNTDAVADAFDEVEGEPRKGNQQAREDALASFIERYLNTGSIWFSELPSVLESVQSFHRKLWDLWEDEVNAISEKEDGRLLDGELAFWLRGQIVKAVRNVILRPDLVIRLLTHPTCKNRLLANGDLAEHFELLSDQAFSQELGGQTIMKRVSDFLDELLKATGSIDVHVHGESRRRALFGGALLKHGKDEPTAIKRLTGEVGGDRRSQICQAFNSPLLPDALVCTSIGQEGIDLHLYCAEVIHHDLPWNPAVLEQRTGRVDRVRSLSEREPELLIQIGVPFLGNNYDQYQYDVLVERAQKFDILMGDESVKSDWQEAEKEAFQEDENSSETDDLIKENGGTGSTGLLPPALLSYLALDLSIWPSRKA